MLFFVNRRHVETISLFPLDHYNQSIDAWINPNSTYYNQRLMTAAIQKKHFANFYNHYLGSLSPWNPEHVQHIISQPIPDDLKTIESAILNQFNNTQHQKNALGYGENFRPYTNEWNSRIQSNMNLAQFKQLHYESHHRAIAIDNLHARALPTDDAYYYHYKIAGQGYPFDNLQISALWAGTPVYILGETIDHAWCLVLTPDFIAWVKASGLARADEHFIKQWSKQSITHLAAIIKSNTSLTDNQGHFLLTAYIGSFFPAEIKNNHLILFIPALDQSHHATIRRATTQENTATLMPMIPSPHHFSILLKNLIGRPYGWGNMYFYNDCSSELKSIFTPFGIWLQRNSSEQIDAGTMVDLSDQSMQKRLAYLSKHGQPFLTLIYVGHHIMLYIGNYPNPNAKNHASMVMTYQNVWGLKPNSDNRRSVIGKSVLFPLLANYPEDKKLQSQADKNDFIAIFLNQLPNNSKDQSIDIKKLMATE